MRHAYAITSLLIILFINLAACSIPQDPQQTLKQVQSHRIIRVGATEAPPWISREGNEAVGIEAQLVQEFADSLGAAVQWEYRRFRRQPPRTSEPNHA
ncbi:MAG: hypothetical protein R3293_16525 [Candidatus Promineifilaceae bacterium]|nr:hypothetical protein [Candidatus Promineifilaceae bacterium]